MLRKYMYQLTQYTYNSRNFNRDFSNMNTKTNTNIFIETKDHIIIKLIYKQTLCTTTKLIHVDKHKQLR